MTKFIDGLSRHRHRPVVIALHSWGACGRQWSGLGDKLGAWFNVLAPSLLGDNAWRGEGAFRLSHEAAPIVSLINSLQSRVHLVGHSYGGAVALRIARERPHAVASLSLYEPVALHVLQSAGPSGWSALERMRALAAEIARSVATGAYRKAAARLVDYWCGQGAWNSIAAEAQARLMQGAVNASLGLQAVLEERTPLVAYRRFKFPTLLLKGGRACEPTDLIAGRLFSAVETARMEEIADAGHMGPMTHADAVSAAIAAHVLAADTPNTMRKWTGL